MPKVKKKAPAKRTRAPDYGSPSALAAFDAETAREAARQGKALDVLKDEWDAAKEDAGAKAKEYKAANILHFKYLRERAAGRGKPPAEVNLFETVPAGDDARRGFAQHLNGAAKKKKGGAAAPAKKKKGGAAAGDDGPASWVPKELWREWPLERLTSFGAQAGDVEKLKAGEIKGRRDPFPIVRMGDLSDFQEPPGSSGYFRKLTDISGIGPAAAERISNACTSFWDQWSGGVSEFAQAFAVEKGHKRPDSFTEAGLDDAGQPSAGRKKVAGGKRDGDGAGEAPDGGAPTLPFPEAAPAEAPPASAG